MVYGILVYGYMVYGIFASLHLPFPSRDHFDCKPETLTTRLLGFSASRLLGRQARRLQLALVRAWPCFSEDDRTRAKQFGLRPSSSSSSSSSSSRSIASDDHPILCIEDRLLKSVDTGPAITKAVSRDLCKRPSDTRASAAFILATETALFHDAKSIYNTTMVMARGFRRACLREVPSRRGHNPH